MPLLPIELQAAFTDIEQRCDPITDFDLSKIVRKVIDQRRNAGEIISNELESEEMAYDFCCNYQDNKTGWGTYYGPKNVCASEGGYHTRPSIQLITEDTINYWKQRAKESTHPVMKARYADLVWDFSYKITGKQSEIVYAHIAIESYVRAIDGDMYLNIYTTNLHATRSLNLAVLITDKPRIILVRDAILAYDSRSKHQNTMGIAFGLLVGKKSDILPESMLDNLINVQERALVSCVDSAVNHGGFPFSVDLASERLANYYRGLKKQNDVNRVGNLWAEARIAMSMRAQPMVGAAWLRQIYFKLKEFGCRDAADRVSVVLRELDKKSMDNMVRYTWTSEITKDEMDAYINARISVEFPESLSRFVEEFIPDPNDIANQIKDIDQSAPLMSLVSTAYVDDNGRAIDEIGSSKDDLEGRIIHTMGQNLRIVEPILYHFTQVLMERHRVTADMLLIEISKSPLFNGDRNITVKRGLEAALVGDHIVAAHLLIPQIEHAIRLLADNISGSIYKPNRSRRGFLLKTLGDLLADEGVTGVLGDRVALYLRVVFTDPRGWNLRNDLLHGILNPDKLGWWSTNRILHAVIMLSFVRDTPNEPDKST